MTEFAKLVISVESRQVKTAGTDLDKLTASAGKTEKATDALGSAFRRLAGPVATFLSARQVARAAESYVNLTNRLRLVTSSTEELVAAQNDVFRVAQASRQPLEATGELYQRIAQNAGQLGLRLSEVDDIAETVGKTIALSGVSAQTAEAGLRQFAQALGAGSLRGDELTSILENLPALAQTIAKGLGVTVGELRKLGAEGVLTSDLLIQALTNQRQAVDQQYGTLNTTVSGALTTVNNAFTALIGKMDETSGASSGAAEQINKLAQILSDPATVEAAKTLAGGIAGAFGTVIQAAADVVNAVQDIGEEFAVVVGGIGLQDLDRLEAEASRLQGLLDKVQGEGFGPGTAIYDNLFGSFEEARARLDQGHELADLLGDINKNATPKPTQPTPGGTAAPTGTTPPLGLGSVSKDAENAAKKLAELYNSNAEQLQRQIGLYNQTGEAARVRYEIENGELSKLNTGQQERLIGLAEEIDQLNEREALQQRVREIEEASFTEASAAAARYQEQVEALWQAKLKLGTSDEEYARQVDRVTEAYQRQSEKSKEATSELDEFAKNAAQNIQSQLADTLVNGFSGSFEEILQGWGQLIQRMIAEAVAADLTRRAFGELGGGAKGSTGWLGQLGALFKGSGGASTGGTSAGGWLSLVSSFAGLFDSGGPIPSGQFGIVGEYGPEIVRGPAQVTGRQETARQMSSGVTIGQMVFPGITNAREANEATAVAARNLGRLAQGTGRYL